MRSEVNAHASLPGGREPDPGRGAALDPPPGARGGAVHVPRARPREPSRRSSVDRGGGQRDRPQTPRYRAGAVPRGRDRVDRRGPETAGRCKRSTTCSRTTHSTRSCCRRCPLGCRSGCGSISCIGSRRPSAYRCTTSSRIARRSRSDPADRDQRRATRFRIASQTFRPGCSATRRMNHGNQWVP
jgi:hypothetical protein